MRLRPLLSSVCFFNVQSGPHIQQAVGMLGLIPKNSLGRWGGGQTGFSFQADGREQGVFVPASLWEVNRKQTINAALSNHRWGVKG